jgi:hypothetical protein
MWYQPYLRFNLNFQSDVSDKTEVDDVATKQPAIAESNLLMSLKYEVLPLLMSLFMQTCAD